MDLIAIKGRNLVGRINALNSELCELRYKDVPLMWGGGKPAEMKSEAERKEGAWPHSEIIMFPVVGSVKNNVITIDGTDYPMGQHGISRYVPFQNLHETTDSSVAFSQFYEANSKVNSEKGTFWFPFSFTLLKSYSIVEDTLIFRVDLINRSERPMPKAFGWHPAFNGLEGAEIVCGRNAYPINEIKETEKGVVLVDNASSAVYNYNNLSMKMETNLKHMQIWSPKDHPLVAIEPVTALRGGEYQGEFANKPGYASLGSGKVATYEVKLALRGV